MYRRNKIGPRTESWGTPEVTGISADFSPSKATHCVRPSKNAVIRRDMTEKLLKATSLALTCGYVRALHFE